MKYKTRENSLKRGTTVEERTKKLHKRIWEKAASIEDLAGRPLQAVKDSDATAIAREFGLSLHDVYRELLKLGVYPYRYLRNRGAISADEQLKLAESKIAVVGAGGLGGHAIMLLARLGIGSLVVVDREVFDETNLNRQALCNTEAVGTPKAAAAVSAVAAINPGVNVFPYQTRLDAGNAREILAGSDVIVDALDSVGDRFLLEEAARSLGTPLVHGTLAGFEGWVMTIFPGDEGLKNIYGADGAERASDERPQDLLGVPGVTPVLIAAFQVMEVLKILLGRENIFRDKILHVDLERGCLNEFSFRTPVLSDGKS
ncbi:MAG TPA: HesA/MoeB/ThiF family protein [Syntrophales bacterium]|nr:HesA/MoeB/ThiF family protein [Syntrophales bacterium]